MKNATEVVLYGHSAVFFWWPLWAGGLLIAGLAWITGNEIVLATNSLSISRGLVTLASATLFLVWLLWLAVINRQEMWRINSHAVTHLSKQKGTREYAAQGMILSRSHTTPFPRWLLGFGAADVYIRIQGEDFTVQNVLCVRRKLRQIAAILGQS